MRVICSGVVTAGVFDAVPGVRARVGALHLGERVEREVDRRSPIACAAIRQPAPCAPRMRERRSSGSAWR